MGNACGSGPQNKANQNKVSATNNGKRQSHQGALGKPQPDKFPDAGNIHERPHKLLDSCSLHPKTSLPNNIERNDSNGGNYFGQELEYSNESEVFVQHRISKQVLEDFKLRTPNPMMSVIEEGGRGEDMNQSEVVENQQFIEESEVIIPGKKQNSQPNEDGYYYLGNNDQNNKDAAKKLLLESDAELCSSLIV